MLNFFNKLNGYDVSSHKNNKNNSIIDYLSIICINFTHFCPIFASVFPTCPYGLISLFILFLTIIATDLLKV